MIQLACFVVRPRRGTFQVPASALGKPPLQSVATSVSEWRSKIGARSKSTRPRFSHFLPKLMRLFRLFLCVLLIFAAAQSPAAAGAARVAPASRPPNVLFLAVDDLRVNLGCYGDQAAITPHLDRLAARGLRFTRAYAQQAVCNPSRQSLLTGRRPDTIRVWDLKTHFRQTSPGLVTLPEYFKRHGYIAQSFGKIFHGESPMADPSSWSAPEQFPYIAKRDDYRRPENRAP